MIKNHKAVKKVNIISRCYICLIIVVIMLAFCGCASKKNSNSDIFYIYDINREYTKLVANEYTFSSNYASESDAASHYVGEALQRMINGPAAPDVVGAIGTQIGSVTYRIEGSIANINFEEAYYNAGTSLRVLRYAAIVRTLCQIDGIRGVSLTVNHEPVVDSNGQTIGVATPDSFLGNDEAKINDYERSNIHLFFVSEDGSGLKEVTKTVFYNSNIIPERVVVENLISGPNGSTGAMPTINPVTKVTNVTVKDGICYVNLNSDFLTKTSAVSDELVIYSIVNSLTRLSNENKVQIMIDGETEVSFGTVYLSQPFEADYSLVK